MDWVKFTINVPHRDMDALCARLSALGYDQLEIEDAEELNRFIEHEKPFWQLVDESLLENKNSCVSFYVDPKSAENVTGLDGLDVVRTVIREEDWMDNWKRYYKPIKIGKRLLIQPEWEQLDDSEDRAVLWCDPGVSFGTGTHATTRMCLLFLDKNVKRGDTVADFGCGSGILSVAALLLGAESAAAFDIDPIAVDVARRNAERNEVTLEAIQGNLLTDDGLWDRRADIVCANLVADLLIELAPKLRAVTGGKLFASGIIAEHESKVRKALERAGFVIEEKLEEDDWVALYAV
ncbi:MAG: 50S ribosomal protein L11 methyltransferase [Oscillospiraceae bacterium]|nr:50S ribosomal protein L11 methyltransferase [Oscillospiraceae bacterium]